MKKIAISVEYDEEKLKALQHFLKQKECKDIKDKMIENLESLYKKVVPANVREYIEASSDNTKKTS